MPDDYFANGGGYRFDMRDVLLGGPVSEWYDRGDKRWNVRQEVAGRRWEGVGESHVAAVLDLVGQRMEAFPPHRPRRGSDVEAWIKAKRDEYQDDTYRAFDDLLDEYRLRGDAGAYLDSPIEEIGPTVAGVTDDA